MATRFPRHIALAKCSADDPAPSAPPWKARPSQLQGTSFWRTETDRAWFQADWHSVPLSESIVYKCATDMFACSVREEMIRNMNTHFGAFENIDANQKLCVILSGPDM